MNRKQVIKNYEKEAKKFKKIILDGKGCFYCRSCGQTKCACELTIDHAWKRSQSLWAIDKPVNFIGMCSMCNRKRETHGTDSLLNADEIRSREEMVKEIYNNLPLWEQI